MRNPGVLLRPLAFLVAALALATSAAATDFYIDPGSGSPAGDGSEDDPWRTLQEVVEGGLIETRVWESLPYEAGVPLVTVNPGAPVKAGDTLFLRTGYHGEFEFRGAYNEAPILITAQPGHSPRLGSVDLTAVQHWVLRDLSISPSHTSPPLTPSSIVNIQDHSWWGPSWDVEVANCDLFTVEDASGWGADEWINDARSGISVSGAPRVTLRDNRLRNVRHGITIGGGSHDALVSRNSIENFSADGMRGLGDRGIFEYNRIQNNLVTDSQGDTNHDDGFQSWSMGPGGVGTGEVRGVVLRGNIFINHLDPSHPLRSSMQAIGCFDGLFVDWVVENNVIITDHWHGITFHGMIDSRIVNNTVLDLNEETPGPPWIRVADSNDTPSQNVVVRNNLATQFSLGGVDITADHNLQIDDAGALFLAPPYDLHLLAPSAAVDAGSPDLAPLSDIEGTPRPQGSAPDLGAYEVCSSCLVFADGFEAGNTSAWSQAVP